MSTTYFATPSTGIALGVFGALCLCLLPFEGKPSIVLLLKRIRFVIWRIQGFKFLVSGPQVIQDGYAKKNGDSFTIPTPSNDYLMITSNESMEELVKAPHHSLSLHAAAKELLQPKYTMQGFEWQDQRGVEGTGFVRALRSLLTSHLPRFQPHLESIIRDSLSSECSEVDSDGYSSVEIFPVVKRIVTRANCFVFFGEELSNNAEFREAALEFPEVVVYAAECLKLTPSFLHSTVASLTTSRHRAAKTLLKHLEPVVKQRLARRAQSAEDCENTPEDCIQWLIDTSPRKVPWSPARMMGEIIAVWFATLHQLAITTTWAIEDLCVHSEYIDPLRQEIRDQLASRENGLLNVEDLPLLDSFVKESARYTNADSTLHDYTFKDGSRLMKNDWVCIPQGPMMQDESRYYRASSFNGFRFAEANAALEAGRSTKQVPDESPATFTTANTEWTIWGLGNKACPGRFYASLAQKLIVSRILQEWEIKMPDAQAPRWMSWRSNLVPRKDTVVMFRKVELAK